MICIYHNRDLDGFCSAAIVKHYHEAANLKKIKGDDLTFIGYDYGQKIPDIIENPPHPGRVAEDVVIVDLSFDFNKMMALAQAIRPNKLIWIDHHLSAIKAFVDSPLADYTGGNLEKNIKVGIGACELAWDYFFTGQEIPRAVTILGEYDTWRSKASPRWEKEIYPFQMGMQAICTSPETFPKVLFEEDFPGYDIIENGRTIIKYVREKNKLTADLFAFDITFMGHKAVAMNSSEFSSKIFDSVWDPKKYDLMVCFAYTGTNWKVSLYTENPDVDCSVMAKKMGGGGHRGASGFNTKNFPDFLNTKDKPLNSI